MRYAIAYHEANGKGFSKTEPYIHKEFKNSKEKCLEIANEMVNEGYCLVTPFVINEELGFYDWAYVNDHKVIKIEE